MDSKTNSPSRTQIPVKSGSTPSRTQTLAKPGSTPAKPGSTPEGHTHVKNGSVSMLPYIIAFSVLILVVIGVLTWVLGEWYKGYQCRNDPNIWCFDTWQCNTDCPTGTVAIDLDNCFTQATQATGLASCIYGPNSIVAQACFNPPAETGTTGPACDCVLTGVTGNCFANCAGSLGDVPTGTICCCCPGTEGCQWQSASEVPDICKYTSSSCVAPSDPAS